jgi:hypothetical protein
MILGDSRLTGNFKSIVSLAEARFKGAAEEEDEGGNDRLL